MIPPKSLCPKFPPKVKGLFFNVKNTRYWIRIVPTWQDAWIGFFIKKRKVFICILPMLPIVIEWWNL